MKAVILNNGSFILTEGEASYFIAKKDFLDFLMDKEALKEFITKTSKDRRAISPLECDTSISPNLDVTIENNYERLGFYEHYNS